MHGILVPFASAIQLSNNNHYKIEDANHLTICKPPNKASKLLFIVKMFENMHGGKNIKSKSFDFIYVHVI
jgi:hypothetical protein